jgi:hypothetical protein
MIQSTINTQKPQEAEWSYPCLGKFHDSELIVLFTTHMNGVIVNADPRLDRQVGQSATDFIMENFTPLSPEESVTLRNAAQ